MCFCVIAMGVPDRNMLKGGQGLTVEPAIKVSSIDNPGHIERVMTYQWDIIIMKYSDYNY